MALHEDIRQERSVYADLKKGLRAQIQSQVDEFMATGGKLSVIPNGISGNLDLSHSEFWSAEKKIAKERKQSKKSAV